MTAAAVCCGACGEAHEGDDDLLLSQEVAAILRVPEPTLRYWRHKRVGPLSFKVGDSVRYRRSVVNAYLREQEEQGKAEYLAAAS